MPTSSPTQPTNPPTETDIPPSAPGLRVDDANQFEFLGCVADDKGFDPFPVLFSGPLVANYTMAIAYAVSQRRQYVALARTGVSTG